jgi:hypothetical protein
VEGGAKRLFVALRAELYFEIRIIFAISLREIAKMMRISRENSAAAGGKNLSHNPKINPYFAIQSTLRHETF